MQSSFSLGHLLLWVPRAFPVYVVWIEALADPTPLSISDADLACDPSEEIDDLLEQMRSMSERELMDQVHRRMTIHLCRRCYEQWIENPTGQ